MTSFTGEKSRGGSCIQSQSLYKVWISRLSVQTKYPLYKGESEKMLVSPHNSRHKTHSNLWMTMVGHLAADESHTSPVIW